MTISNVDKCMQCGLCNSVDPIQAVVRKESASSRYKIVLAKQGKTNPLFYLATDAGLQEVICPAGVKLNEVFRLMREKNVVEGIITQDNEEMKTNFLKTGFPYANLNIEEFFDKKVW